MEEALALRLGTNFGGGARKGELCGAVSGALMVLGLLYGHSERGDAAAKARSYALAEEYMNRFIRENGSAVCRELLGYDLSVPEQMASIRDAKRLCLLKKSPVFKLRAVNSSVTMRTGKAKPNLT